MALFVITGAVAVIYALEFIGKHLPRGARKLISPETTSMLALFFIAALIVQIEILQRSTSHQLQTLAQRTLEIQQDRAAGYLVTDDEVLSDINQEHGTIRRIFIVDSFEDIPPQDKAIINQHLGAGVKVMLAKRTHIDTDKQTPILVESTGAFGWRGDLGPNNALTAVLASTNPAVTDGWRRAFNEVADDAVALDHPLR